MDRRRFLELAAALGAIGGLGAGTSRGLSGTRYDAVVGSDRAHLDAPRYDSIGAALAAVPGDRARPYRIFVGRGRFRERLVVDRPDVHLIGADRAASVVTHDTAAGTPGPDGKPAGTWGCATVAVRAPGFRASRLTLENAFDYLGHLAAPKFEQVGPNGAQAVALMLAAGADRSSFRDVEFIGHQDTLFADAGRSLFEDCRIRGSVDFVFGAGQAYFERCTLHSRFRPGKERQGYVAVPSTSAGQAHGLTFHRCRLTRDPEIPDGTVALGRAWRPSREFPDGRYGDPDALGLAAYLECWMDAHIAAQGWDPMSYAARDGARVALEPGDARLFEHRSSGPGARIGAGRRQLDAASAARHARDEVLAGWSP